LLVLMTASGAFLFQFASTGGLFCSSHLAPSVSRRWKMMHRSSVLYVPMTCFLVVSAACHHRLSTAFHCHLIVDWGFCLTKSSVALRHRMGVLTGALVSPSLLDSSSPMERESRILLLVANLSTVFHYPLLSNTVVSLSLSAALQ
jgi:uncharacterized membrane protein YbaN (DUF454 family)